MNGWRPSLREHRGLRASFSLLGILRTSIGASPVSLDASIFGQQGYAPFLLRLSTEKGVAQMMETWRQVEYPGVPAVDREKGIGRTKASRVRDGKCQANWTSST